MPPTQRHDNQYRMMSTTYVPEKQNTECHKLKQGGIIAVRLMLQFLLQLLFIGCALQIRPRKLHAVKGYRGVVMDVKGETMPKICAEGMYGCCVPDAAVLSSTAFDQVSTPDLCDDSPRCKSIWRNGGGGREENQCRKLVLGV